MMVDDFQESWKKVLDAIIDAGVAEEFHAAVMKSAEAASRAAAATYDNERMHLRMSVRSEFCYELADGILRAREASETEAKVKEAERIREELARE
jgi:hypothetical protein